MSTRATTQCCRCGEQGHCRGGYCTSCRRAYNCAYYLGNKEKIEAARKRRRENGTRAGNREWIESLKAVPCMDCKHTFPSCCMQFDHVRGKKVRDVSEMLWETREVLAAEVAKCEVVCANCHFIRTHERRIASGRLKDLDVRRPGRPSVVQQVKEVQKIVKIESVPGPRLVSRTGAA